MPILLKRGRAALMTCLALAQACGGGADCISACVVSTPDAPTANVRFINAVPDSGGGLGLDFRFVDQLDNVGQSAVPFRNGVQATSDPPVFMQVEFRQTRAGNRRFGVFLSDVNAGIASNRLVDSTATLETGRNYTFLLWGNARAGSSPGRRMTLLEESTPDLGAKVGLRVINATGFPIDVRLYVQGATKPATPVFAGIPGLSASSYVVVDPARIMFNVTAPGGSAALFPDLLAPLGAPASGGNAAQPGTTAAGSAVTLIVFPPSTAGSRTPQTAAFQVPAGSFVWNRLPP